MGSNPFMFLGVFFIAVGAAKVIYALILKRKEEGNCTDDSVEETP